MKPALALAALLGLALAPAAYAQVDCGEIRRVMAEARNAFDDISGAKVGDRVYESSYLIGGAKDCYVDLSQGASYYCLFIHEHPDSAFSAYGYRLGEVRRCLSNWKQTAIPEESPLRGDGFRSLEGFRFQGSSDYRDFEWIVMVEQHIENDQAHYHVRVQLDYH